MILKADRVTERLRLGHEASTADPLVITPEPDLDVLESSGSASVDLRLGSWFVTLRQARMSHLSTIDNLSCVSSVLP
jgi:hypothetical protein